MQESILAVARKLQGETAGLFFERSSNEKYVAAYMFDVHTGEMVKRDMSTDLSSRGHASILTSEILNDLKHGG